MRWLCVFTLLVVGCSDTSGEDDVTDQSGTGSSTTGASSSDGGPTGDDGSGDTADGGDDGSGDATQGGSEDTGPGSTGSADADTGSESGGGSTDEGGACDPDAQPNECLMCVATPCCNLLGGCEGDEGCACLLDCHVEQGNSIGNCKSQCNASDDAIGLYNGVYFCGQMSCLGTCDWDVG